MRHNATLHFCFVNFVVFLVFSVELEHNKALLA